MRMMNLLTHNPDDNEQHCDKYESSPVEIKAFPNGISSAEASGDPMSDRYDAAEVVPVTNM
jgi:hypothetical protein